MKLPAHVRFEPNLNLVVWRPRGVLDETAVNQVIGFIGEREADDDNAYRRFSDLSALDSVDLNFKYMFHVALYRRLSSSGRPKVKSAFLVTDPKALHYIKLHAVLTQGSALHVKRFESYEEAAKWLEVAVESIKPSLPESAG